MFNSWQKLKKIIENKDKHSEGLIRKEQNWATTLKSLFDIGHANALNMITVQEDKEFFYAQCQVNRHRKIGKVDSALIEEIHEIKMRRRENKSTNNFNKRV